MYTDLISFNGYCTQYGLYKAKDSLRGTQLQFYGTNTKYDRSEMRSMYFVVASLALLAVCTCAPVEADVIQHIPLKETPSATGKDAAKSGAAEKDSAASEPKAPVSRARRELGGQESDLLPSHDDVDGSPFGDNFQLAGHGRIKVLPAYLG